MKPKLVMKQWGMETWFVNGFYCGKRLIFAENHRCSLHYHKIKNETFLITSGCIWLEIWSSYLWSSSHNISHLHEWNKMHDYMLNVGDTFEISRGMAHRMTAVGGNASMIEFSTHHEDSDSYRLESGQVFH